MRLNFLFRSKAESPKTEPTISKSIIKKWNKGIIRNIQHLYGEEAGLTAVAQVLKKPEIYISGEKVISAKEFIQITTKASYLRQKIAEQLKQAELPPDDQHLIDIGKLHTHSQTATDQEELKEEYYQVMAYQIAYRNAENGEVIPGPSQEAGNYIVSKTITNDRGLQIVVLVPEKKGNPPILACRGTYNTENLLDDLSQTIGRRGRKQSSKEIKSTVEQVAKKYGPIVVCGHSLGGGIAQAITAKFASTILNKDGTKMPVIKTCYHYNAPGCGRKVAKKYARRKEMLKKSDPTIILPQVVSWRQSMDIVSRAGGPHLEADKEIVVRKRWELNIFRQFANSHTDLRLSMERPDTSTHVKKGRVTTDESYLSHVTEVTRQTVRKIIKLGLKKIVVNPQKETAKKIEELKKFVEPHKKARHEITLHSPSSAQLMDKKRAA